MSWTKTHLESKGTIGLHHAARRLGLKEEEVIAFAREGKVLLTPHCWEDVVAKEGAGSDLSGVCWSFSRDSVENLWPSLQNEGLNKTQREITEMHRGLSEIRNSVREASEESRERMDRMEGAISDCYEILSKIYEEILSKIYELKGIKM